MRFGASAKFTPAQADVDPVSDPADILIDHIARFKGDKRSQPAALHLALLDSAALTLTVDLYYLVEYAPDSDQSNDALKAAATRWIQFATAIVITNGEQTLVTANLPAGGPIYVRRTADTIGAEANLMLHYGL